MNILMIDDDYLDLEGMQVLLKQLPLEISNVYTALSARAARETVKNKNIHIILCDVEMPEESGLDFARWLNQEGIMIPLIFVTSHASFEYAAEAVRLHVHDYLLKPVSAKALQEAMTRASAYGQVIKEEEDIISPVTNYIREHLSEKISREQLADLVYLHPDYLTHVFKEKTGLSLSAYILKERLKQSKNLLRNTDKSINTIALDCGFSDASYFTRIFRRETGISPRQYREGQ
ncbi:MAG: response regulator [Solobacterium sp.]|nr:response regulator [Solobacterium sp.]